MTLAQHGGNGPLRRNRIALAAGRAHIERQWRLLLVNTGCDLQTDRCWGVGWGVCGCGCVCVLHHHHSPGRWALFHRMRAGFALRRWGPGQYVPVVASSRPRSLRYIRETSRKVYKRLPSAPLDLSVLPLPLIPIHHCRHHRLLPPPTTHHINGPLSLPHSRSLPDLLHL